MIALEECLLQTVINRSARKEAQLVPTGMTIGLLYNSSPKLNQDFVNEEIKDFWNILLYKFLYILCYAEERMFGSTGNDVLVSVF